MALAAGVSTRTVRRWVDHGLLPLPQKIPKKKGGYYAVYPLWAINRCRRIKRLIDEGYSIPDIKSHFDSLYRDMGIRLIEELIEDAKKAAKPDGEEITKAFGRDFLKNEAIQDFVANWSARVLSVALYGEKILVAILEKEKQEFEDFVEGYKQKVEELNSESYSKLKKLNP